MTDTSKEAVEAVAAAPWAFASADISSTLRALSAERDAAVAAERERCAAWVRSSDLLWPDDGARLALEIRKGPTP